jgi:hypothetical protein
MKVIKHLNQDLDDLTGYAFRRSGRFKVIVPLGSSTRIWTLSEMAIILGSDEKGIFLILKIRCDSAIDNIYIEIAKSG